MSSNRTLPIDKWKQVIKFLYGRHYDIVILGTENDLMISDIPLLDLRGKTSIVECKEIISRSSLFISTDSALFHVASATDTPIVGIFSIVDPETRITRRKNLSVVTSNLDVCKFQLSKEKKIVNFHECQWSGDSKFECIKTIDVNSIKQRISYLLKK